MTHITAHAGTGYETKEVSFRSWGVDLKGLLFVPEDFDESKSYPAVVFSGPLTQIKEQMGSDYGRAFARRGYILLSFDHYGHGESAGEPRNHENSEIKKESVRDAISYLRTLHYVDRDRLYGLGGCAAGGYMPLIAVTDKRLKGVATASGYTNSTALYFEAKSKEEMIEILSKHLCEKCKLREKYEEAPRSLIGKFWRWHINFCPGWRAYYNSLNDEQRKNIFVKYGFKK